MDEKTTSCIDEVVQPVAQIVIACTEVLLYSVGLSLLFCNTDKRNVIAGPIKNAMIAYLVLFLAYTVYSVIIIKNEYGPNRSYQKTDNSLKAKIQYLHIMMDVHTMIHCITWLYVLFRLKRVEILMNPEYSTRISMKRAINKHSSLSRMTLIIYILMFVLQRS